MRHVQTFVVVVASRVDSGEHDYAEQKRPNRWFPVDRSGRTLNLNVYLTCMDVPRPMVSSLKSIYGRVRRAELPFLV